MKLKLDENLGVRVVGLLRGRGHDEQTVPDQRLCAASDESLIQVCRTERRCLVTLDLDFGNPLLFAPREYAGIAVLRLPRKCSPDDILDTVETLASALSSEDPAGRLWIVQKGRIRVYQDPKTD